MRKLSNKRKVLLEKNKMEYVPKEWVTKLCNETKQIWKLNRNEKDHAKGFAIFYSCPKINPTIAFIGYNPGGDETDFDEQNCTNPTFENVYLNPKYPLAQKINKIFEAGDLMWVLEDENYVKFNLYFFRSKEARDINNKEMKKFCEDKIVEILKVIKPKYIVAEGIKTYDRLKELLNANEKCRIKPRNVRVFCFAKTEDDTPLLGIKHPTGGWGISNKNLELIVPELKKIIKK